MPDSELATAEPPMQPGIRSVDLLPGGHGLPAVERNALFLDPRWLGALHDAFSLDFRADVRCSVDGRSWLPYSEIADRRGRRIVSLPFCDAIDTTVAQRDWAALVQPLVERGAPIVLKTDEHHPALADPRFESLADGVDHLVAIDGDPESALNGYATLARRQIRRARRSGVEFVVSTSRDDLRRFHDLHVHVRKTRHRLLAQPFALFEGIADRFFDDDAGWLVLGVMDGRVEGGCLVLRSGRHLHYKFGASSPMARSTGISYGAIHETLRLGHRLGAEGLELGRSDTTSTGLIEFKRRFRPVERTLYRHSWAPHDATPLKWRRSLDLATRLLTNDAVPDRLSAAAGARLYRFFS